jgi:cysteinyl-tRNA synthetase
MSKSKGNYFTFRDLKEQGFSPVAIRYLLLSVPYRKQINFTLDALRAAERTVDSLRDFRARLEEARVEPGVNAELSTAAERAAREFEEGLDDDLNTSVALAAVHNLTREVNSALACGAIPEENKRELTVLFDRFDSVLNVFGKPQTELLDEQIQQLIDERQEARRRRDFARADEIRDQLSSLGIVLEDKKDGVRWRRR